MDNSNNPPTEQNTMILEELTSLIDENTGYQKEIAFWTKVTGTYFLIKLIVLAIQIGLVIATLIIMAKTGNSFIEIIKEFI